MRTQCRGGATGWSPPEISLRVHHYRLVAMRVASFAPAVIRERAETALGRGVLERYGLMLALRYTADIAPMRSGRAGHRLVRDGMRWRGAVPMVVRHDVERMWLTGVSRTDIAQATGLGPTSLAKLVRDLPRG